MENLAAIGQFNEIWLISLFGLCKQYGEKVIQLLLYVASVGVDDPSAVEYEGEVVFFGVRGGKLANRRSMSFGLVLVVMKGKVTLEALGIDHDLVFAIQ